ncbi:hypothetical protein HELRODRAFT_79333 [Helobdella robusta]|uniref:Reverse transcriptase domain-containing protein n=1 Tax=Helobdella robusta TaxID=6412 RepID=T1G3M8_HELRO|nr:hypothetical protein HELRODRAFT_79333 [Helobdella robusta]ESO04352.1 hypothetical protein HELRODRAFT_79333 [Helobdella robusta]
MCFVDFRKAFYSLSHDRLWLVMLKIGYPFQIVQLLLNLFKKQIVEVKVVDVTAKWFPVRMGVK